MREIQTFCQPVDGGEDDMDKEMSKSTGSEILVVLSPPSPATIDADRPTTTKLDLTPQFHEFTCNAMLNNKVPCSTLHCHDD